MPIPNEEQGTQQYEDEQQYAALHRLIDKSGMSEDFVIWYLNNFHGADAMRFEKEYTGDRAVKLIKSQFSNSTITERYAEWQQEIQIPAPSKEGQAEARQQGVLPQPAGPFGLFDFIRDTLGKQAATDEAGGGADDETSPGGALIGSVADVFSGLTSEELQGLGAEGITEKFGLQRLAIEDPEAFLQAMFDKAGITASPPVYGFLRDLMPSITLLASTREGQDIINSPGGAVQLNKAINEVISQGYPSKGSILEGLSKMGGTARSLLGEGQFDTPRQEFRFVAATLNDLIGPTMSQPMRQALFNTKTIETQGDRFLSAAARGVYKGSFIDWLKAQGYPLPDLPAYTPTPGATADAAGGGSFVAAETGGATGTSSSGAPTFQARGGVYKEQ